MMAQKIPLDTIFYAPMRHDKSHLCMRCHSDPYTSAHLSLGTSGQGTSAHVPRAAHPRAVLEGSHTSSLPYTHASLRRQQRFLSPRYRTDYKKSLWTAQGCSLCSTGRRCLKKPFLCPASHNALAWEERATPPAWPSPLSIPSWCKGCWSDVLLPVEITYTWLRRDKKCHIREDEKGPYTEHC